jgi:hypothetical protein
MLPLIIKSKGKQQGKTKYKKSEKAKWKQQEIIR